MKTTRPDDDDDDDVVIDVDLVDVDYDDYSDPLPLMKAIISRSR
jgi:hypothetical protein